MHSAASKTRSRCPGRPRVCIPCADTVSAMHAIEMLRGAGSALLRAALAELALAPLLQKLRDRIPVCPPTPSFFSRKRACALKTRKRAPPPRPSGAHAPRVTALRDCHARRVTTQGRGGGARTRGSNVHARLQAVVKAVHVNSEVAVRHLFPRRKLWFLRGNAVVRLKTRTVRIGGAHDSLAHQLWICSDIVRGEANDRVRAADVSGKNAGR